MNPERCDYDGCYSDLPCALGERDRNACEHWRSDSTAQEASPSKAQGEASGVPWSGATLGISDTGLVAARGPTTLVGVLGPHNAGKTTLLTTLWMMLLRGAGIAGATFAGSYSIGAWEGLAAAMRWCGDQPPGFPLHTSLGEPRRPGLLHIALRTPGGQLREILFTDAPGEWFLRWSTRADDPQAEGAAWTAHHADALIVVADSARLAGEERGVARGELRGLLERLRDDPRRRPTRLLWSKSDHQISDNMRSSVRTTLARTLVNAREAEATTEHPQLVVDAVSSLVEETWSPKQGPWLRTPVVLNSPFGAFRGRDVGSP